MAWDQLKPTPLHLSYLILSTFLVFYTLFSTSIKNRLYLAEPPLATALGFLLGPRCTGILQPRAWYLGDHVTQELTRLTIGMQVFVVGLELPQYYCTQHWKSVGMLLGPVMAGGWVVCALFIYLLFDTGIPTALIISACLTPTDPVLAASVLDSSEETPERIKRLLSAESGSNDGVSFPFLYIGLFILQHGSATEVAKAYLFITILWQCICGITFGLLLGFGGNRALRLAHGRGLISPQYFSLFHIVMAIFCIGLASTLGLDDFLLAFSAGVGFARDGWFSSARSASPPPVALIDLVMNSSTFIYFGALIPWSAIGELPTITAGRVIGLVILVLLFRRLPFVLAFKRWIPDIKTWKEALFCGHFGPMGVGALFLAIEARAQLEGDIAPPLPRPPENGLDPDVKRAVDIIWPIVCLVVLGSIVVHGFSMSIGRLWYWVCRRKRVKSVLMNGSVEDRGEGAYHDGDDDLEQRAQSGLL
ncbi:hypothetical protein DTO217A2_7525 [Paecilomyces variotii]|nr:hypothetical protein DTO217A2_7525 [Paecilomyces variotii]